MAKGKLVILGLDGADWKILEPLIAEGCLPNFKRVMEAGSHARLRSTVPALTAPAWTSIFTGTNPGKHGIFDFVRLQDGKTRAVTGADILVPYVWELMPREKAVAFNIPLSYPLRKCSNAIMVSGFGTPGPQSEFTSPPGLKQEILQLAPQYGFDIIGEDEKHFFGRGNKPGDAASSKKALIDVIHASLRNTLGVARYLLEKKEWDAAFLVFQETDWIQHHFMHHFFRAADKSGTKVAEVYRELDAFLGYLMDKHYNVLIVSDHGFVEVRKIFFLNTYLKEKGLLKIKEAPHKRFFRSIGISKDLIISLIPLWLYKPLRHSATASAIARNALPWRDMDEDMDLQKTSAYLLSQGAWGVVLRNPASSGEVAALIKNSTDENGQKAIKSVLRREDVYSGPALKDAPHLFAIPAEGFRFKERVGPALSRNINPDSEQNGAHGEFGIFLSCGPDFRKNGRMPDLSVMDITPTVLAYFGYSMPAQMDGAIIPLFDASSGLRSSISAQTKSSIHRILGKLGGRKR